MVIGFTGSELVCGHIGPGLAVVGERLAQREGSKPEYSQLVNIFGLAIKFGLKTGDLKRMVSAYPSVGSDFGSLI